MKSSLIDLRFDHVDYSYTALLEYPIVVYSVVLDSTDFHVDHFLLPHLNLKHCHIQQTKYHQIFSILIKLCIAKQAMTISLCTEKGYGAISFRIGNLDFNTPYALSITFLSRACAWLNFSYLVEARRPLKSAAQYLVLRNGAKNPLVFVYAASHR